MAIRITHAQNSEDFVSGYRYYRATGQNGAFALVGSAAQPASPASAVVFNDPDGTLEHWYKVAAVTTDDEESLASDAFQPDQNPILTRVWDIIKNAAGQPMVNIDIELRTNVLSTFNGIIVPQIVRVKTDTNGFFFADLHPNALLSPEGTYYFATIPRVDPTRKLTVPQQLTARLSDLINSFGT